MILNIVLFIVFWIIFYIFEGKRDGHHSLELNQSSGWKDVNKKREYNKCWHNDAAIYLALTHLAISFLFAFVIGQGILFGVGLTLISVSLRVLLHDGMINITRGISWNYYSTCDYKGDWWDCFLITMRDKGIPQWIIRGLFLIISIAFTIFIP